MEILKSNSLNVKLVLMCVVDIFSKYLFLEKIKNVLHLPMLSKKS